MVENRVSFNDLHAQYLSIKDEIDDAIASVIKSSSFIRGKHVQQFEEEFAALMEAEHCVSCANGTDALYIAMRALGAGPGDEVIVPAHTWIATSETVSQTGAKVVFCDTDPDTYNISVADIEKKISPSTVGIIPVHLFGQPAQIAEVCELADRNNLWVLEDCAQAHLATKGERKVGTFGTAATFSFYPGKNLGAMGDAGAIVTNDAELADRMAMFARHGGLTKGQHKIEGINSRMDGLQAAILVVKLAHIEQWTEGRRQLAAFYNEMLSAAKVGGLPKVSDDCNPVWHLYVIRSERRDELKQYLADKGVQTVINYPIALPFLEAYSQFKHSADDFPAAFYNQSRILSLPLYPEMSIDDQQYVVDCLQHFESKE